MYITYTIVLSLGLLVTLPYYLVRFRKYLPTLSDRLGFLRLPQLSGSIWVHAVSVGEVKAVERLIEQLRQQFPGKPLVVSTATPAGQQLAQERRDIIDHTFYFPIDLPFCVDRAVERIDPQMVIIAETEIWPNFLRVCRDRRVPVVMINGRISDRSFGRYLLVRRWLARVFADYTVIGMQSEMDRERIQAIGANPHKVTVFGNLKYDVTSSSRPLDAALAQVLSKWKQVWIAASTMPGEEELVLDAFAKLRATHSDLKLVIAPRHADRFDAVEEIVKREGLTCLRRSLLRPSPCPLPEGEGTLLLDSIGELASVFQYATVVFMGGSLVAKGGHNVLEPARYERPIVFGPHMENFRDIARLFLQGKAAIQIRNAAELAPTIERLLSNPQLASELGRNARAIMEQNTGATDRVLRFLQPAEAPVSTAFRLLLQAREKLYNSGILATVRLNHPVISVGNLTLGGTGKTPLVIALAERLRERGLHPVILSRGYRRQSRDIIVAGSDWEQAGDEPCLMTRRLGNIPVVVGADRYQAGLFAERKQLGNIFILDDGFQHRRLYRDVDIIAIDPAEWAAGEALLPAGRWREPKSAIERAHAACVQEIPGSAVPSLPIPTFLVRTEIVGLYKEDAAVAPENLKGRSVVAFAGIAKPDRFFAAVESLGIQPLRCISFPDHHPYSRRDFEKLGGEVWITTEKDAVRLAGRGFPDFVYLRISANIPDFERLMKIILERLPKL